MNAVRFSAIIPLNLNAKKAAISHEKFKETAAQRWNPPMREFVMTEGQKSVVLTDGDLIQFVNDYLPQRWTEILPPTMSQGLVFPKLSDVGGHGAVEVFLSKLPRKPLQNIVAGFLRHAQKPVLQEAVDVSVLGKYAPLKLGD